MRPCICVLLFFFFSAMLRPPSSPLFPYTTLFRSPGRSAAGAPWSGSPRAGSRSPFRRCPARCRKGRSEEHTSELQSRQYLVCRLLLEKKNTGRCVRLFLARLPFEGCGIPLARRGG